MYVRKYSKPDRLTSREPSAQSELVSLYRVQYVCTYVHMHELKCTAAPL